jgi:hypothetical protein
LKHDHFGHAADEKTTDLVGKLRAQNVAFEAPVKLDFPTSSNQLDGRLPDENDTLSGLRVVHYKSPPLTAELQARSVFKFNHANR